MDREQFLEQLAAPAGGKENIGLCDFRSGCSVRYRKGPQCDRPQRDPRAARCG